MNDSQNSSQLDLQAYLQRIAYHGDLQPNLQLLKALHLAHATHIPFENLDILLGKSISLDLYALQRKLLYDKRGGYCFEQNLLFAQVLETLGFSVKRLSARVRYQTNRLLARTHMLLLIDIDGLSWVADVGFGGEGLLLPVPFSTGETVDHFSWTYRIIEQDYYWVLQSLKHEVWNDLYAFTREPQQTRDYEMANYYVSTHPDSRFTQTLTVQLPTPEARYILTNREFVVATDKEITRRVLADNHEILHVLAETFKLVFPPETQFNFQDAQT